MKIKVIQPPYPHRAEDTPASVDYMVKELRACDETLDLILLPECSNAPSGCGDCELLKRLAAENTDKLLGAARETAVRCHALVGINLYLPDEASGKLRNATVVFDTAGEMAAKYDKLHLPISEYSNPAIDHGYIESTDGAYIKTIDGIRFAFLTCYDMYYTEMFSRIAEEHPDVVIVCSLQRGERHDMLETEAKTCAFLCNAYLVRSSYYMGEGTKTGGCSMIVAPDGAVLGNMKNGLGSLVCEIGDVHYKYSRANGFGQPPVPNDEFQTMFRAPWAYRAAGSGVIPGVSCMKQRHLSAENGFTAGAPANTVPCVALAVSLGAREIGLTVRCTKDGVPVLADDACGAVTDGFAELALSLKELKELDPGKVFGNGFDGVRYASLEEVFAQFPRRAVFTLRIPAFRDKALCAAMLAKIRMLAKKYDCLPHVCILSEETAVLETAAAECAGAAKILSSAVPSGEAVAEAVRLNCTGIRVPSVTPELAAKAHENGLSVSANVSGAEEAAALFAAGADCAVTKDYLKLRNATGIR